ncbi:hypothetical protein V7S43_013639 [Phytophthora oleae]|uniref:DDE Tnp4 domain-containing protein n=1 Tax=Phytophthora oleae TaxID=2107226 RepID=A0ABD3F6X2_9STRA
MSRAQLCLIFGVPPATLSRVLNEAETTFLSEALKGFGPARIVWLAPTRQQTLAKPVEARQPLLKFTWGFIDGKNYRVEQPSDTDLQNAHYNGWLHQVFVTSTICFSADGLIVWANHNCPGSWNNVDTGLGFRRKLSDPGLNPDPRFGVVADSAFPCAAEMTGRIQTPLKESNLGQLHPSVRPVAKAVSGAITFVRQAAEWGMGSIEKVYHRLLLPLPFAMEKRQRRIDNLFRLANFRVRKMDISQVRTTHFHYERD